MYFIDPVEDSELQSCFSSLTLASFNEFASLYIHDFVNLLRHSDSAPYCEVSQLTFSLL